MAGRTGGARYSDDVFGGDARTAFERLSAGTIAVIDNVDGLLEDASILVDSKRYDRAEFLYSTAQEEMGKAYILLDMCRVDLARQDVLRRLCGSFYSHVLKRVYFDLSGSKYDGISTLPEVQHFFKMAAKGVVAKFAGERRARHAKRDGIPFVKPTSMLTWTPIPRRGLCHTTHQGVIV